MELTAIPSLIGAMDRPIARRRLGRPALAVLAASVIGCAAGVVMVVHPAERVLRVSASRIGISKVVAAPFQDFIPVRGQVVPLHGIVLDAIEGGHVEQVMVEAGQRVVAGQPLMRLSDPSLELDAIARETQIIEQMNAQRTLQLNFAATKTADAKAVAEADYNILRLSRQIARRQPLVANGFVSLELLEQTSEECAYQARLRSIAAIAGRRDDVLIRQSQSLIDATALHLQENLAAAKRQIEALTVRAPSDGVLTELDAYAGEAKTRGQHLGQIDLDGGFKLSAELDEFYLARVKPGQTVSVTIDGVQSSLQVSKIYPQVNSGKFAVDFTWRDKAPRGLRRGQAVQGRLELGDAAPGVTLPNGAFLEATGGAWVFLIDDGGTYALRRTVKLGRTNTEAVEVLDGLSPGDRVVTSDYAGFARIDRLVLSP